MRNSVIIADQTGVGKGRIAASIIRYALLNNKKVMFFTEKNTLFSDMVRDLEGIGFLSSQKLKIFEINKKGIQYNNVNFANNSKTSHYSKEPVLFCTYSQVNRGFGGRRFMEIYSAIKEANLNTNNDQEKEIDIFNTKKFQREFPEFNSHIQKPYKPGDKHYWQKRLLLDLAKDAILILDEAHNAAGNMSNSFFFFRELIEDSLNCVFLSATWAKRPDNMLLYHPKTVMNLFSTKELVNILKKTGTIGQSILSNVLVQEGQLLRRETSFEGVKIDTLFTNQILAGEEERVNSEWTKISKILQKILLFDIFVKQRIIGGINEGMKEDDTGTVSSGGDTQMARATSNPFSSRITNMVSQIDLVLKTKSIIKKTKELVKKENKKVVIGLMSTNDSFFSDLYAHNDKADDSFNLVFIKTWKKLPDYNVKTRKGIEKKRITEDELRAFILPSHLKEDVFRFVRKFTKAVSAYDFYHEILKDIKTTELDDKLSVIDTVKNELIRSGIEADEITGRQMHINDKGYYVKRKRERTEKITKQFNNEDLDVLIINVSGATGISLHASETFANKKQRVMLMAQPHWDINVYVQMMGRIHRTGQVKLPEYIMLNLPIPTAKRFAVMLRKKLSSLNANTKGDIDKEDQALLGVTDMANKIGDKATKDFADDVENTHLNNLLGNPLKLGTEKEVLTNQFLKFTGRLPILTVKQQEEIYSDLEDRYQLLLAEFEASGKSLDNKTLNWNARLIDSKTIIEGDADDPNVLNHPVFMGVYTIPYDKKKYQEELRTDVAFDKDKLLNRVQSNIQKYYSNNQEIKESERHKINFEIYRDVLNRFRPGFNYILIDKDTNQIEYLRCLHIDYSPKEKQFPANPSALAFHFVGTATLNTNNYLRLIAGQETLQKMNQYDYPDFEDKFFEYMDKGNNRKVLTGNLLKAIGEFEVGKYITFTLDDGRAEQGILVPQSFDFELINFSVDDIISFILDKNKPLTLGSIYFTKTNDDTIFVTIPRANKFSRFYQDEVLNSLSNSDGFVSPNTNTNFYTYFESKHLRSVIERLIELGMPTQAVFKVSKASKKADE